MSYTREVGEDRVLQDNLTRIAGKHSLKMGYEMIWTLYSNKATSLPSGQYNFGGATTLPFAQNTGNDFAAFEMGAVTSATFTKQLAIFLPRQWDHELYIQDDWKVSPTSVPEPGPALDLLSPYKTKYDQQSQFDPTVKDPVTGLMGAITHPTGAIGKRDLNNFQPRLGLAWNFHPKWVFRSSFGIMTVDSAGAGRLRRIRRHLQHPAAHGRSAAPCSCSRTDPGPLQYTVNADGTVPYTGASYNSRNATWRDPNLRNPYVMNWSAGFQYQMGSTWVVNLTYQGTAGVGLERSWNINQIPLSIALGGNRALQDTVFQAQQNYLMYPQFGSHQPAVQLQSQHLAQRKHHRGEALRQRPCAERQLQLLEVAQQ